MSAPAISPPQSVEACSRALRNGRIRYADNRGEKSFREAASHKLQRDNGLKFDPATEALATAGATFGIYAARGLDRLLEGLETFWQ